ncbi:MAG: sulfatase [Myxococcales bacterium]|nr:sulfatase [Myxococcales bacterium]
MQIKPIRHFAAAALSPAALLFGLVHGLAGAVFLFSTNYDLRLQPVSWADGVCAAIGVPGLLMAIVGLANLAWQVVASLFLGAGDRSFDRQTESDPVEPNPVEPGTAEPSLLQQVLLHGVVSVILVVVFIAQMLLMPTGQVVAGIFTGLWFGAAMACGAALVALSAWQNRRGEPAHLLDPGLRFPTATALIEVAVPTWTFIVIIEGMFHYGARIWVPMDEISALLMNMTHEAEAMLLGPEALRLGGLIAGFFSSASLWAIVWRKMGPLMEARGPWRERLPWLWLAAVVLGISSMLACTPRMRRLAIHHSHPSLHQLSRLAMTSLRKQLQTPDKVGLKAANELFPGAMNETGLPAAHTATNTASKQAPAKNALIIFIDSISRQHLEPWGYERPVDPHLRALAASSIRFDQARSNAGQTDLGTIALFYSLFPLTHLNKANTYKHGHGGRPVHLRAKDAGFAVGLFSADWEVHDGGHAPLHPGQCDAFVDARIAANPMEKAQITGWAGRREDQLVGQFLRWHDKARQSGKRTFSYVKFLRPHAPYYTPPNLADWQPPWSPTTDGYNVFDFNPPPGRVNALRNRYDNAIHFADHALGKLIAGLKRTGALDDTVIVFLTDHGEGWGQHGIFGHASQHFEEIIDIPLLLRLPGGHAGVDNRMASTIDVAPTLLDALGLPPGPEYQGRSLLDPTYKPRFHFAWSDSVGPVSNVVVDQWKLIWIPGTDEQWLFNLSDDPNERNNLAGTPAAKSHQRALRAILKRFCAAQLAYVNRLH